MILTSKLGRFEFDDEVLLSHAKLIRDDILGQWFNPHPGSVNLETVEDIENFIRSDSSMRIAAIPFTLAIHEHEQRAPVAKLKDLPKPPLIPIPPIWVRQALVGEDRPAWLEGS